MAILTGVVRVVVRAGRQNVALHAWYLTLRSREDDRALLPCAIATGAANAGDPQYRSVAMPNSLSKTTTGSGPVTLLSRLNGGEGATVTVIGVGPPDFCVSE